MITYDYETDMWSFVDSNGKVYFQITGVILALLKEDDESIKSATCRIYWDEQQGLFE